MGNARTDERHDDGTTASPHARGRRIAVGLLLAIGYALALPVLFTMVDGAPNDAIVAWLDRPIHMGSFTLRPIWLLIAGSLTALGCWIGAGVLANRHTTFGTKTGNRSTVRPLLTALTLVCAFFVCLGLPMLCITHW